MRRQSVADLVAEAREAAGRGHEAVARLVAFWAGAATAASHAGDGEPPNPFKPEEELLWREAARGMAPPARRTAASPTGDQLALWAPRPGRTRAAHPAGEEGE
ncbi:MAG: hypothetical protein EPN20_12405 [Magnetospirillum sp.]|nr:MAG: hypothetical protein EPN20_12405 [Magnetospirillum sp.]